METPILKVQEIPYDHPDSRYMFQPRPDKPFLATPAAIEVYRYHGPTYETDKTAIAGRWAGDPAVLVGDYDDSKLWDRLHRERWASGDPGMSESTADGCLMSPASLRSCEPHAEFNNGGLGEDDQAILIGHIHILCARATKKQA